jgi:hypothetical protein
MSHRTPLSVTRSLGREIYDRRKYMGRMNLIGNPLSKGNPGFRALDLETPLI